MASTIELEASARSGAGKGAARSARRQGMVPCVVYGDGKDPVTINIRQPVLLKALKAGKFLSTLIKLSIDGSEQTVICRGVQRDVVKDMPIHADFLRLSERSMINLSIPVEFENMDEAPGIKKGGVLTVVRNDVEVRVRANAIPEVLVIDLSGMEIGDTARASELNLPEGARLTITDRDFMIANISAPSVLASDDEEEGDEEAAAEGAAEAAGEGSDG